MTHKIGILFLVILLLQVLPGYLPRLGKRMGRKFRRKTRFARELLDSTEKPGGPLARFEELAGEQVLKKCLSKTPAIEKTKEAETVERIGRRLAACARRSYIPFRFFLVDSPGIENAYAISGGNILITQALLDFCSSEDEIAGVLAHEIAHIDCGHHSKALAVSLGTSLVILDNAILRQAGKIFDKLIESGYSQDNEFEADREGALLAKRAGFDPFGNMDLMKMEEGVYAAEEHSYFSTHPPRHERIRELRKLLGLG